MYDKRLPRTLTATTTSSSSTVVVAVVSVVHDGDAAPDDDDDEAEAGAGGCAADEFDREGPCVIEEEEEGRVITGEVNEEEDDAETGGIELESEDELARDKGAEGGRGGEETGEIEAAVEVEFAAVVERSLVKTLG